MFVGLGNPGLQYQKTRHNVGHWVVQEWIRRLGWPVKEDRHCQAYVASQTDEKHSVHLLLPLTYMNLSGQAIERYLTYLKLSVASLVVVVDDIALPFGRLRLRSTGSAGGHNGLKSVSACLGTSHYKRLRIGIGHPGEHILADYVLESFNQQEQQQLPLVIDRSIEVLQRLLKEDFSQVMMSVNTL